MGQTQDAALLGALLEAAVDAIVVADADGTILRVNDAASRLFRQPAQAMLGSNVKMLMPQDMAAQHDGFMHRHLTTGKQRIIGIGRDVEGLRGDGTTFPLHLSVGRTETDGKATFIAVLHDQSQRRSAEEALTRSQRMDAVGQMTGGIAHDFNNLLTVVIGNLELLEMQTDDAATTELIQDALHAAELGADLTSRLLLFSRKGELRPRRLDVNCAIGEAVSLLKRTMSARCRVEIRLAEDLWPVEIDPTQFQTAIVNLALNAQDAMPSGGRLVLRTENVAIDDAYVAQDTDITPGLYVRLTVSDNGVGMDTPTRMRVLEPFFTTKPAGKGTGLGLSMVYGFAHQSGGHLTLYSEPGRGTTVGLYFPAVQAGDDGPELPSIQSEGPEPFGADRPLLVVEDDPAVRRLTVARVSSLGFRVVEARDADEAWDIVMARDDIDHVFTDLVMPGSMTGRDLADRLAETRPNVRVLLSSGYSEGMQTIDERVGRPALLRKPYRQADLAQALRSLFDA